jgi:tRNA G18 (ribose-2'-O)-methylase SpoU
MPLVDITDADDPRLADYRDLTDVALRSAAEPALGLYMAEGEKVIARALAAGHHPRSVLVEHKRAAQARALLAHHPATPIYSAPESLVRQIAGYRVHRGYLAAMHRPRPRTLPEILQGVSRILVLEDLVDHTNVGAAFRSAAALGFDAVLVSPRCADPLYRRSIKVSMGAVLSIPWAVAPDWPDPLQALRADGFALFALIPDGALDLAEVAAAAPHQLAVLIGTEGAGLTAAARAACHAEVRIPMSAGIDSLNAAAATAVACYALRPAHTATGTRPPRGPSGSTG